MPVMEPVTLRTERLSLRPLERRDVDAVLRACQDPDIGRWTPLPDPYRRTDAENFVLYADPAGWRDDTMYNFGVFTREGALVGSTALVRLALGGPERQAELGYWTAAEHRRRGYAAEAGRAVADWAFTALGVERLEWCAQVGNAGSREVALRIGFAMEGVQRSRIVHRGVRRDAWVAALLPSDLGREQATPYVPSP